MAVILSKVGVKPEMAFRCCDCGETITGQQVLEGEELFIVQVNKENPEASVFRCEPCHDEWEERFRPE
ncbi:MAG: hypothetical protein ACOYM3_18230 [Terrimicrobiaceae bacterium]